MNLDRMFRTAHAQGWALEKGTISDLQLQAHSLGWQEVPTRRNDATAVSTLRPTPQHEAHPQSLSATYGLGAQPLHTDGAHLPDPPDWVVLSSETANATPTKLLKIAGQLTVTPWDALREGMFLIKNGRDSFYAPALSGRRHRFDPGCMEACDDRSATVAAQIAARASDAYEHHWTVPGQVLLIDNRETLHARAAVVPGDANRQLIRIAYRETDAR